MGNTVSTSEVLSKSARYNMDGVGSSASNTHGLNKNPDEKEEFPSSSQSLRCA